MTEPMSAVRLEVIRANFDRIKTDASFGLSDGFLRTVIPELIAEVHASREREAFMRGQLETLREAISPEGKAAYLPDLYGESAV